MTKIGERVGAVLDSDPEAKVVHFLGYGIYEGDFIPAEAVGMMAEIARKGGCKNPRLLLDGGRRVYGCECWWGGEASVKKHIAAWEQRGYVIQNVDIDEVRTEVRKNLEAEEGDIGRTTIAKAKVKK